MLVIHLHVDDTDAMLRQSVEAGSTVVREMQDEFQGERPGRVRGPFGYERLIGHPIEELSPAEVQRRYTALFR